MKEEENLNLKSRFREIVEGLEAEGRNTRNRVRAIFGCTSEALWQEGKRGEKGFKGRFDGRISPLLMCVESTLRREENKEFFFFTKQCPVIHTTSKRPMYFIYLLKSS